MHVSLGQISAVRDPREIEDGIGGFLPEDGDDSQFNRRFSAEEIALEYCVYSKNIWRIFLRRRRRNPLSYKFRGRRWNVYH